MTNKLYAPGTAVDSGSLNDFNTATYSRLSAVAGTNTITSTGPNSLTAYTAGQNFFFSPAVTNTGPVTINISGVGVRAVTKNGATALVAGDLVAGTTHELTYDGAQFQVINPSTLSTGVSVPAGQITGQVAIANGGTAAASAAQALINLGATGRLIGIQVITAIGTYTPTSGTTSVVVEAVGGGGGGGAITATAAGQTAAGGGGGSGTWGRGRYTSGFSGVTVTIGAAGVAGVSPTFNGGAGGQTSFGALLVCPGGAGGVGGGASPPPNNSANSPSVIGAAATGANISSLRGAGNTLGFSLNTVSFHGGAGGSNPLGTGGPAIIGTPNAGSPGTGFGAGGSGAAWGVSAATQPGGAGTPGVVIVYEYA